MTTSTKVPYLKINKLTKEQFKGISNPSETELYFITDGDEKRFVAGEGISIDPKLQTAVSVECSNPDLEVTSSYDDTESSVGTISYEFECEASQTAYSGGTTTLQSTEFYILNGKLYKVSNNTLVTVGENDNWSFIVGWRAYAESYDYGINNGQLYSIKGNGGSPVLLNSDTTWQTISGDYVTTGYLSYGINGGKLYRIYQTILSQIGSDTTWSALSGVYWSDSCYVYGINDGKLYSIQGTTATQVGTDTTWTLITGDDTDKYQAYGINNGKLYRLDAGVASLVNPYGGLSNWSFASGSCHYTSSSDMSYAFAIREGELYAVNRLSTSQIGTDTTWSEVRYYEESKAVGINNGYLYKITAPSTVVQLGEDSGWSNLSGAGSHNIFAQRNGVLYKIDIGSSTPTITLIGAIDLNYEWRLNNNPVNLADYDLTVTGNPSSGDTIDLTYTTKEIPDTYIISRTSNPVEIYEFIINTAEPDPTAAITYVGANASYTPASMDFSTGVIDYGSWENAFFQPRPVMVKYDGTVDYELDKNDFTKKLDGTASDVDNTNYDGNCMIAFPQVWMKFVEDNSTHQHVYIANSQVDDNYHCYTHQNKNGTWLNEIFINAFEPSNVSSKLRSLAGQTILGNLSGETMRTYAQSNGSSWDFMDYGELQMLQMLCVLMFKSLDTQAKIGTGVVGGSSSTYTTTGSTKDKGMFYALSYDSTPIKVFGIENLWGNKYKWINGLVIPQVSSSSDTATVKYKLCDYTTDGSTATSYTASGTGYKTLTTFANGGTQKYGYPNKLSLNSDGLFADPANLSGSTSTYIPDYAAFGGSNITSYNLFAYFGGAYNNGLGDGLFFVMVSFRLSNANVGYGASLSCKPL